MTTVSVKTYVDKRSDIEVFKLVLYDDRGVVKATRKGIGYHPQGSQEFVKLVDPSEHYFKKFKGYAMASAILEEIIQRPIKKIRIIERDESGTILRKLESTPSDWVKNGQTVQFGNFEKQVVLPCRHMLIEDGGHTREYKEHMKYQTTITDGVK